MPKISCYEKDSVLYHLAVSLLNDRVLGTKSHLFFPEFIDAEIKRSEEFRDESFKKSSDDLEATLSLCVKGLSKKGNNVVAFVHEPHYFMVPENLFCVPRLLSLPEWRMYGTALLPKNEWQKVLEREGNGKVFVTNYDNYRRVNMDLREPPCDIRFLGGENLEYIADNPIIHGLFGGDSTRFIKFMESKNHPFVARKQLILSNLPMLSNLPYSFNKCASTLFSVGISYMEDKSGFGFGGYTGYTIKETQIK